MGDPKKEAAPHGTQANMTWVGPDYGDISFSSSSLLEPSTEQNTSQHVTAKYARVSYKVSGERLCELCMHQWGACCSCSHDHSANTGHAHGDGHGDDHFDNEIVVVTWMKSVRELALLDDSMLHKVAKDLKRVSYEDGQMIIKEGDFGTTMYIVESGEVVCQQIERGEVETKVVLTKGQCFGQVGLLDDTPRNATILAHGSYCRCIELPRKAFLDHGLDPRHGAFYDYRGTMANPGAVISVLGGRTTLNLPVRLEQAFERGLMKCAMNTNAVVFSNGFDNGQYIHRDPEFETKLSNI